MNRYSKVFTALSMRHEAAFIPFAVAGDPDLKRNERIFKTYVDGGADILEIGYPFSDPVADGPVNQRAAQRAIEAGLTHSSFFALVKNIRAYTDIPIGVLLYANTIFHCGPENFCRRAAQAGIDSLLIADMPPEESFDIGNCMVNHGIGRVFIVSELTPVARMEFICSHVDAFVYVVSRLGATGVGQSVDTHVAATIARLRTVTPAPLAVGFGISTPAHVRQVCRAGADGAIVGSALVSIIESNSGRAQNLYPILKETVRNLKRATQP